MPDRFSIVTDLIRAHGYQIAFIGKLHVQGALMDRYWDYYFNLYRDPAHMPLSRQLAAGLEELRHETGDRYAYQPTMLLKQEVTAGECNER